LLCTPRIDILDLRSVNQSYENNRFDVDHRPGDGRVPEFLQKQRTEKRRANGFFNCVDDSRKLDNEEEFEHQEDLDRFG
jgi:hypothetical protein